MVQHSGRPGQPSRPSDVFDLICGTATGGLIAILLGRLGMTCDEAIQAYDNLESAIFDATPTIQDILARRDPFDTSRFQTSLANLIQTHAGNPDALMLADNNSQPQRRCRVETMLDSTHSEAHPCFTIDPRHFGNPILCG